MSKASSQSKHAPSLTNDIIGNEDWKRSKLGYLTGFSAGKRSVGEVATTAKTSFERTAGLISSLRSDRQEILPRLGEGGTPSERFQVAMILNEMGQQEIQETLVSTYRASILYAALASVCLIAAVLVNVASPPGSVFTAIFRFGPLPLLLALYFKKSYVNWLFRNQIMASPLEYLLSMKFFPTKNGSST